MSPNYVTAVAIVVSALINISAVYFIVHRFTRRAKASDVMHQLIANAVAINQLYASNDIQSPYGFHVGGIGSDNRSFNAKAAGFLNQLNLLRVVFHNKDLLGKGVVADHISWARDLVAPWMNADSQLRSCWELFKQHDQDHEFVEWAATHFKQPLRNTAKQT
jgi:hypothetical protein